MADLNIMRATLEKHFGYREFLGGQEEPVASLLDGQDTVIIMPTGGGKSLCYQLPALLLEGVTVVVSPLIALMKDQVDALSVRKIPAAAIHSGLTETEISMCLRRVRDGDLRLLYVAPERFKSPRFTSALAEVSVALFAVDEAHCISQWGHDFRPDYMRLRRALDELGRPTVAALTATATPEVRDDIITQLGLGTGGRAKPLVFVSGFARENLNLSVAQVKKYREKIASVVSALGVGRAGIVYCATRKKCEQVATDLKEQGVPAILYHAGLSDADREKAQNEFSASSCPVVVATNAFGMGIDRPDIRCVLHVDIPGSMEAYYQEAGRAGRDGNPAECLLLYNAADRKTQEFFIDGSNPTPDYIRNMFLTIKDLCAEGPIEIPIHEIASRVDGNDSSIAAGTALSLLQRAGFITRDYRSGSRTYRTEIVDAGMAFEDLKIDFDRLQEKRERDMAKLAKVVHYAHVHGCRQHFILDYFGDRDAPPHCLHCDNCKAKRRGKVGVPDEEQTVDIQKILSCIARMKGRYGRGRVIHTLAGSRSKEVIDARLDQLSTYGIMKDCRVEYIGELLSSLIAAGCVVSAGNPYPVVQLTPLGQEVMMRRQVVSLFLPEKLASGNSGARKSSRPSAEAPGRPGDPDEQTLFERLRRWRMETMAVERKPIAYMVFPDNTLRKIAAKKPRTLHELGQIKGVGKVKLHQYGTRVLEQVAAHVA